MLSQILIHVLVLMVALMWLVPNATSGGVAVRQGSVVLGVLALLVISLANHIFWHILGATGLANQTGTKKGDRNHGQSGGSHSARRALCAQHRRGAGRFAHPHAGRLRCRALVLNLKSLREGMIL